MIKTKKQNAYKSDEGSKTNMCKKEQLLEVDGSKQVDYKNIVNNFKQKPNTHSANTKSKKTERENSVDFIDDPSVPPLI